MSKRPLTSEEKRLWRESNRFTKRYIPEEEREPEAQSEKPSPVAARQPPRKDPTPARTPQELTPLSALEAKKRMRSMGEVQATLDLHGMTQEEAYRALTRLIARAERQGLRHVVVITGKGRGGEGVLKRCLPQWLSVAPLRASIAGYYYGHRREGGEGLVHVLVKRIRG